MQECNLFKQKYYHNSKDKFFPNVWVVKSWVLNFSHPPSHPSVASWGNTTLFPRGITVGYYLVHHSFSSYTMYTSLSAWLGWFYHLIHCYLVFFQDKLSCALSGFAYDIICRRSSCHLTSILSFTDLASVAGILRICKLAVVKLHRGGEEFWQLM